MPDESAEPRPQKELKAFAKVHLAPGETRPVSFLLDALAFAVSNACQPEAPFLEMARDG